MKKPCLLEKRLYLRRPFTIKKHKKQNGSKNQTTTTR